MEITYPVLKSVRSVAPTKEQEPVTLSEAKKVLDIADSLTYHDSEVESMISEAREAVERDANLVCYTGTFTRKFHEFPCGDIMHIGDIRPITSITSITYVDTAGDTQTWSASNYALESSAIQPYVRLAYGAIWPVVQSSVAGITVTFVAGYASVATMPGLAKRACLTWIKAHWQQDQKLSSDLMVAYQRLVALLSRETYS